MRITKTQVEMQCRKIPNWKAPGLDGVQGHWFKKIKSCHERIAEQIRCYDLWKARNTSVDDIWQDSARPERS